MNFYNLFNSSVMPLMPLVISAVLGGIVGFDRERDNKNAGLRTHILVCVASALVMITSKHVFLSYTGLANVDPTRLGAQVISGIGFLGAGAILKEGASIKGLTTAAGLWTVACIGLACGAEYYEGAVFATVIIMISLTMLKRLEKSVIRKTANMELLITTLDEPGQVGKIGLILGKHRADITNIKLTPLEFPECVEVCFQLLIENAVNVTEIIDEIKQIDGIKSITQRLREGAR